MPIHIIRYEDILVRPLHTMTDLMKFILNTTNLEGTLLSGYIEIAC